MKFLHTPFQISLIFLIIMAAWSCKSESEQQATFERICASDPTICELTDRLVSPDTVATWLQQFQDLYEENGQPVPDTFRCPTAALQNFVDGYDGFRVYFGLASENLNTIRLIVTRFDTTNCSDIDVNLDENLFYWNGDSMIEASILTETWRSFFDGIGTCDTVIEDPITGDWVQPKLAFAFNVTKAKADFLDSTQYAYVAASIGLEEIPAVDPLPSYYQFKLVLSGDEGTGESESAYLDFAQPCPILCGSKNKLQTSEIASNQ
ncbi:MAG: hypothetical protein MRZ79_00805 [Bacteroidia bacterium]|nr:hypothetical protein [Bacteroidia bacterium]